MSDGKVPMPASGQESKGATGPDGVNNQWEVGQAGEGGAYPNPHTGSEGKDGDTGFMGHGGQTHLADRSKDDEQFDEEKGE